MPKRRHPRAVIFEQLCGELLTDPFEEVPVGRHHDADGDGLADQDQPETLRAESAEPWCEDRADPGSWDDPDIDDTPEAPDAVAD